jgi:hypothetical protein
MPNERDEARSIYLRALDQRSHEAPLLWWTPDALVAGYTEAQILDALKYLEDKGFANVRHAVGDGAMSAARITLYGQDFISNTDSYLSDRALSAFAHATINVNVSGGSGKTLSGNVTPRAVQRAHRCGGGSSHAVYPVPTSTDPDAASLDVLKEGD